MAFAIQVKNGQVLCPCCGNHLWHCKACWLRYHNSADGKDYISPEYYGQPMNEDIDRKMKEEFGIEFNPTIKADKNRKYIEGEYH